MSIARLTPLAVAAALLVALGGSAVMAGPIGLIDDFEDTDLSDYNSTVILDAGGTGSNTYAWQSPAGSLELDTSVYDGIEQYAFIRSGLTLAVGQEVQADVVVGATGSQDIGLYVGGTTPVTGVRVDYIAMYRRNSGQLFSRGFDGTSEYPLAGDWNNDIPIDALFIARTAVNTYEAGWYDGGVRNVLATRTPTTPNDGDVVGFYADVRAAGTVGGLDNLRIVPEPASMLLVLLSLVGLVGLGRKRR